MREAPSARSAYVWDPLVRVLHWALAGGFLANALLIEDESVLHRQVGYAVLGIVGLRVLWGLVGPRHARFAAFPPSLRGAAGHLGDIVAGRPDHHLSHNPLGALMVYNLLATIALIGATGLMMRSDAFWGVEWVEEAHELLANWGLASAGLHVAGVLFEQHRSGVNLVRAMITGRKAVPPGAAEGPAARAPDANPGPAPGA